MIVLPVLLGMCWSVKEWLAVGAVKIDVSTAPLNKAGGAQIDVDGVVKLMLDISKIIQDGAMSFLFAEYKIMGIYIVLFSGLLYAMTNYSTTISFVVGAVTSIVAGWIGMKIAVKTNVVTTFQCWHSLDKGFDVAIQGGCVMGLSLVCIGILDLWLLIVMLGKFSGFDQDEDLYDAIAGYGLGGSSIALFGRVGGGIYTKAADVGADLSGKNDFGLEEDDYRNPACIADNVGDNVGDIAGMGADLFGSFAESTCAALVLVAAAPGLKAGVIDNDIHQRAIMYPVLISSLGVVVGWLTLILAKFQPVKEPHQVEKALKGILVISTVLMTPVVIFLSWYCLPSDAFEIEKQLVIQ
jgi:inorganic pyrophosphatase